MEDTFTTFVFYLTFFSITIALRFVTGLFDNSSSYARPARTGVKDLISFLFLDINRLCFRDLFEEEIRYFNIYLDL